MKKEEKFYEKIINEYPCGFLLTPAEGYSIILTNKNRILYEIKKGDVFLIVSYWPDPKNINEKHKKEVQVLFQGQKFIIEQVKAENVQEVVWSAIYDNSWFRLYNIKPFDLIPA